MERSGLCGNSTAWYCSLGAWAVRSSCLCLRDIVQAWREEYQFPSAMPSSRMPLVSRKLLAATKRIRLVWVIKSRTQLSWLESHFEAVLEDLQLCRIASAQFDKEIEISIYITCDETLETNSAPTTSGPGQLMQSPPPRKVEPLAYDEKKAIEEENASVRSLSMSESGNRRTGGCGPNGTCCCTVTVEDESSSSLPKCTCSGHAAPMPKVARGASTSASIPSAAAAKEIKMLAGRPHPRTIIRHVLERAEGESAVVVCGPKGLAADVRQSVVSLSDERAVHKGTGAQGIYLHVETFGW